MHCSFWFPVDSGKGAKLPNPQPGPTHPPTPFLAQSIAQISVSHTTIFKNRNRDLLPASRIRSGSCLALGKAGCAKKHSTCAARAIIVPQMTCSQLVKCIFLSNTFTTGLILVSEPYYNEAGYEKQKGTQQGHENSRMYNEMAILKMVQVSMSVRHVCADAWL